MILDLSGLYAYLVLFLPVLIFFSNFISYQITIHENAYDEKFY